jgi:L-malate glycosyltransferase
MRIIELCLAKSLGGLELYFERCCNWFHQSPHYCLSITLKGSRLDQRLTQSNIPVINLNSSQKFLSLFNAYKLALLIENHNIDVLHVHHKNDLIIASFSKIFCKKKFALVHSRQMQIPHSKKDVWHKLIYKRIDLFITITEKLRADAIKKIPLAVDKIKTLYYGVRNPDNAAESECKSFFSSGLESKFKIGIFSRFQYLKGQHLVIEAAKILFNKYQDIAYFLVGDVMDQTYFSNLKKALKEHPANDVVHFRKFHPQPLNIMHCFDIILLPSYNETFGLVLAEAMRSGVAVIGTNFGGVTEIIDDNKTGLLFEKNNLQDLVKKIELLYLDEELRKRLALQGKAKADQHFNEEHHFEKLEKLFLKTMGK